MKKARHDTKGVLDETKFSYYHPADAREREYGPYVPVLLRWFNSFPMLTHLSAVMLFSIQVILTAFFFPTEPLWLYCVICFLVGGPNGAFIYRMYIATKIKKDNK